MSLALKVDISIGHLNAAKLKWYTIQEVLASSVSVLSVDPDTVLIQNPFEFLSRDSDVESASDGWDDVSVCAAR